MPKLVATCVLLVILCGCRKNAAQDQDQPADILVQQCAVNLGHIDAAKKRWAQQHGAAPTDTPTAEDLDPFFRGGMPQCPEKGTYTIGTVGELPQCSIPAHNNYFRTNMPPEGAAPPAKQ